MPQPNKRKKQLADGVPVQDIDAMSKRRKTSKLLEERLKVPKEDSSPIDAIVVPDAISSLHGNLLTPEAEAATNTNTASPDVATSLPTPVNHAIAEAATSIDSASPDVVASFPSADLDVVDDDNTNRDNFTDTQSNNHPRATNPSTSRSTSMSGQGIKLEPVVKTETAPAPSDTSTSAQEIKREPVVFKTETAPVPANTSTNARESKREPVLLKTETAPAPAPVNPSIDQAAAPVPTEPVITNGPHLNRTVTVHRKAAKRTALVYLAPPPPQNIAVPLSPPSQADNIAVTQDPRVEEPLPTTTDEAASEIAAPDVSEGLPSPDTPPCSTAAMNASTRRRSRRHIQLPPIETSEAQPNDTDDANVDDDDDDADCVDDDGDLSEPAPLPTATVNAPTRRRSRVIPTSTTGAPVSPPTATMEASSRRQSRRQTELLSIETSEAQLGGDYDDGDVDAHVGDLSGPSWKASWEGRLSELADYRKIHGHCKVPRSYSESMKLGRWVAQQNTNYGFHLEGKTSPMTSLRIQELERLGFEWYSNGAIWEERLSELTDYRKIHGHCNVPKSYIENIKLGVWVSTQRQTYKLNLEGKTSPMTALRIQALESLGFEWDTHGAAWEERLSELADYRKIQGHCNVSKRDSENDKLGLWVSKQRSQYKLHLEGKTSPMTSLRIQALESLGFEWDRLGAAWEERLSELTDYRKIQGHCNVPKGHSENTQLGVWVATQRKNYKFHLEGKQSPMTALRIQALESLGFE
jgi:hypothetical protein